jgi:hypothetical protein
MQTVGSILIEGKGLQLLPKKIFGSRIKKFQKKWRHQAEAK